MISIRISVQALEMLDYLKTKTNASGRERVLEQLIHDAYVELQERILGDGLKPKDQPPKRR